MKKLIFSWLLSILFLSATTAQRGEERTGYDGDFFSLEGAIDLFKNSNTIADFERRLNEEDTYVNNLDLDRDGQIDFIRVEHIREGSFHAIVLQVPLNRYDVQDIAVIEIEKTGRRRAMLQIVGDEDIYGEEVIVEPYEGNGYSRGRGGPNADYDFNRGYVNVFWWSPVQHIFGRQYRVYRSPYYWSYYPNYWRPWRPCGWNVFRPRIVIFHRHYHHVHFHRLRHVHNFYRPYRHYSHHVVIRSNQLRVKHGRPAIQRQRLNHGTNRKEFRPGLKKVNNHRVNSTAQVNIKGKGNRINSTNPRTSTRQNKNDRNNINQSPTASSGRDRTRTSTTRPSKSDRYKSGETRSTRTPKANSGGRVSTKPSRSSDSKVRNQTSSKRSKSSASRSTKPSKKSSSVRKSSSRSSSPKTSRSSSRKSSSSSKATRSRSSSSSKGAKSSRSSKSSKSRSSSKKGRG
ncbi:MAG: hypothetical protein AB8F94_20130 [Saprospiraceae bacterium]